MTGGVNRSFRAQSELGSYYLQDDILANKFAHKTSKNPRGKLPMSSTI